MPTSLAAQYREMAAAGSLSPDASQLALVERLDALVSALSESARRSKRSSLGWLFARGVSAPAPRGLYIWGAVGRGKTLLMDLFYRTAPTPAKRRVHFHAFMAEVHDRIAEFRRKLKSGEIKGDDPIRPVASNIAEETRLLCFDEFAVTDIADAMILGRLFERLFEAGVTIVATSNVAPEMLYEEGLNRALFLPFIAMLQENMAVFHLEAPRDYRLDDVEADGRYLTPLGPHAEACLRRQFQALTGAESGAPREIASKGRVIVAPEASDGVARFPFEDLCARPLAAGDYLKIAEIFHTLLLSAVPVFDLDQRNEAKRMIILVDTLYDLRRRLILSAAAEPQDLFVGLDGPERMESGRTASRLTEMRSDAYWETSGPAAAPAVRAPRQRQRVDPP